MTEQLLKMKEVRERVSLSRQEIYRRIKTGNFPEQIQLGPGRVAWVGSEVDQWIVEAIARGRRTKPSGGQ